MKRLQVSLFYAYKLIQWLNAELESGKIRCERRMSF